MHPQMQKIQAYVVSKDREMKKQATRVQKAMRETVDLDGLGVKIFGKYLKFLQQKVAAKLDPATSLRAIATIRNVWRRCEVEAKRA